MKDQARDYSFEDDNTCHLDGFTRTFKGYDGKDATLRDSGHAFLESIPRELHPARFNRNLLPCPRAWDAVSDFFNGDTPPRSGLFLFGQTGTGKTRAVVSECYDSLRCGCGSNWSWWSAYDLKKRLTVLGRSYEHERAFIQQLGDTCMIDTLVLDDMGHVLSDGFGEIIRDVLDRRGGEWVITSNYDPDEFAAKHGEIGKAIMRRIVEHSVCIRFARSAAAENGGTP